MVSGHGFGLRAVVLVVDSRDGKKPLLDPAFCQKFS